MSHCAELNPPVLKLLNELKPASILELGCGNGDWYQGLRDCGAGNIVGVDIWPPSLSEADRMHSYSGLVRSLLPSLAFTDKSFDLVFCAEIIEHLSRPDGARMIDEASRVAKRYVVVTCPGDPMRDDQGDLTNPFQRHRSVWNEEDLVHLGFEIVESVDDWFWGRFLIGLKRLQYA